MSKDHLNSQETEHDLLIKTPSSSSNHKESKHKQFDKNNGNEVSLKILEKWK